MRGTTSIMNSALKHGTSVKRIVLTSSLAAVREVHPDPHTYDETNWNNQAVEAVETKGSAAGPIMIYLASKTLAERAAWDFVAAHKADLKWDLVVLNPPWVFGVRRRLICFPPRSMGAYNPFVPSPPPPCTAVSHSGANDRRYQHVPARCLRHTYGCLGRREVTGSGELGARVSHRGRACARDARGGRWR